VDQAGILDATPQLLTTGSRPTTSRPATSWWLVTVQTRRISIEYWGYELGPPLGIGPAGQETPVPTNRGPWRSTSCVSRWLRPGWQRSPTPCPTTSSATPSRPSSSRATDGGVSDGVDRVLAGWAAKCRRCSISGTGSVCHFLPRHRPGLHPAAHHHGPGPAVVGGSGLWWLWLLGSDSARRSSGGWGGAAEVADSRRRRVFRGRRALRGLYVPIQLTTTGARSRLPLRPPAAYQRRVVCSGAHASDHYFSVPCSGGSGWR